MAQHGAVLETEIIIVDLVEIEMNEPTYHKSDYLHSSLETINSHIFKYMCSVKSEKEMATHSSTLV